MILGDEAKLKQPTTEFIKLYFHILNAIFNRKLRSKELFYESLNMLQSVSGICKSLTWLNLVMVVWFQAQAA